MKQLFAKHQCTGCGNCISFCPKHLLQLSDPDDQNDRKVQYIQIINEQECILCGQCVLMCTAGAIKTSNSNMLSSYDLIDKKAIPPHAGCYLGSLTKALADVIAEMRIEKQVVIFKKRTADVNLNIETYDYLDENFFDDALAYKRDHPDKLVILICSSSKELSTAKNRARYLELNNESVTVINTLNWFESDEDFTCVTSGGSHMLEEVCELGKASFIARGGVKNPYEMHLLESYLQQAIKQQIERANFSIVEIVFPCFYRLAKRPQALMHYDQISQINRWFEAHVEVQYTKGILKEGDNNEYV